MQIQHCIAPHYFHPSNTICSFTSLGWTSAYIYCHCIEGYHELWIQLNLIWIGLGDTVLAVWPRSKKATGLSPSWELPHVLHVTVWVLFGCLRRKTSTRLVGNFQFTVSVTDCLFICVVLWWTGKGVNQPLPLDSWHGLSRPRICWTFWGNSALDSTLLTSAAGFRIYYLYSVFYLYYSLRISVWKCANSFHFDKVLPLLPPPPPTPPGFFYSTPREQCTGIPVCLDHLLPYKWQL